MVVTKKFPATFKGRLISVVMAIRVKHTHIFKDPSNIFFNNSSTPLPLLRHLGFKLDVFLWEVAGRGGVDTAPFAEKSCLMES